MKFGRLASLSYAACLVLPVGIGNAQQAPTVIFHRDEEAAQEQPLQKNEAQDAIDLSEADRSALTFTAYDLDLHLNTETSNISARARLTVRNDSEVALTRLPLQVTSTMHWEAIRLHAEGKPTTLPLAQHELKTDLDHTGAVNEAIVTLPWPLAPGASIELDALYSGPIQRTTSKESSSTVSASEWDRVTPAFTGLRGFGNVLWYPVAAPPEFLGDGNKVYDMVGRNRLRTANAKAGLRLTVEYLGEPPKFAFFSGQVQRLDAHSENPNEPTAAAPGIATATFASFELGFHPLSLILSGGDSNPVSGGYLSILTEDPDDAKTWIEPGLKVFPLMTQWLGAKPNQPLAVVDTGNAAEPFEAGSMVALPIASMNAAAKTEVLAHVFTHAYTTTQPVWLDEGLAQFMSVLWAEQTRGREVALGLLNSQLPSLALIEPDAASSDAAKGQPLADAHNEIYYRTKAAMVFWMLRSITSDTALQQALQALRSQKNPDTRAFQQLLEQTSQKDLAWFFDDWVYNDRGLPDLSIVSVTPRAIERASGYLIAVEVSNAGGAAAEVPVTVRSGSLTTTERLRIPARSRATTRIVFNDNPQEVLVNDGSTPEQRSTTHSLQVAIKPVP